jgi:hypothetical protein
MTGSFDKSGITTSNTHCTVIKVDCAKDRSFVGCTTLGCSGELIAQSGIATANTTSQLEAEAKEAMRTTPSLKFNVCTTELCNTPESAKSAGRMGASVLAAAGVAALAALFI